MRSVCVGLCLLHGGWGSRNNEKAFSQNLLGVLVYLFTGRGVFYHYTSCMHTQLHSRLCCSNSESERAFSTSKFIVKWLIKRNRSVIFRFERLLLIFRCDYNYKSYLILPFFNDYDYDYQVIISNRNRSRNRLDSVIGPRSGSPPPLS